PSGEGGRGAQEIAGARRRRAPDDSLHREVPLHQGSGQAVRADMTSPAEADAEANLTLAAVLRAGNDREAVQIADRAVRVQPEIGHVASGIAEPRPVGHVERLNAQLQVHLPRHVDLTEYPEIP